MRVCEKESNIIQSVIKQMRRNHVQQTTFISKTRCNVKCVFVGFVPGPTVGARNKAASTLIALKFAGHIYALHRLIKFAITMLILM